METTNDNSEDSSSESDDNSFTNETGEIVIQCCHLCSYKSDSQKNLTRHIRTAHTEKEFECPHCGKKFVSRRVVNQHIRRSCKAMKREQKFQRTPANPAENVEKDEETGEFKCSLCPFTAPEEQGVVNHIEKIHVKLVCNLCSAEFSPDDDVSDHACADNGTLASTTEGGSKMYNCDQCSYTSSFRNNVEKHMRSVHRKERNYLCSECGSQFSEQKSLTYHLEKMRIIHEDGSTVFRCAKFTKIPSRAGEHVHKDEVSNIYLCQICDYTSQSLTDTKRHIQRIHLGEKRFICNTCNRGFSSQPEVGRHLARDHNDTSFLGDSVDISTLKPETYTCQQCTYESPSRINVERHFSVVHLKERNYQCTECGQRYSDKKTLLSHVEKNQVTLPDGKVVLQCTKFTKLPSRAGEHLRRDEASNLFHCVLCNYSSKNQTGAKRHVERMHLKEKRFVCNTCSQDFISKRELAYHLGMDHNDLSLCENGGNLLSLKPEALQCEYCEYSSTVRQYLERHVKAVHLKERNFVCSECGFAFSEKKSLQGHLDRNTVTSPDGEAVLQCSKYRKLPSSAGQHIAKNNETNEFYCLQCSYRCQCYTNLFFFFTDEGQAEPLICPFPAGLIFARQELT
jgi:KRAB domain-containing zinc finger protein